jgi:hypothetical protein
MAKANVLARRIRAYDRTIDSCLPRDEETRKRYVFLRAEAVNELDAFLVGRTRGPWMGYANADEAAYAA